MQRQAVGAELGELLDDVHDVNAIKEGVPFSGWNTFPATTPEDFVQALQKGASADVPEYRDEGAGVVIRTTEAALQQRAARNPVAVVLAFEGIRKYFHSHLIKLPDSRDTKTSKQVSQRGILGIPNAWAAVLENNSRESLHLHEMLWSGLSTEALTLVAHIPRLRSMALKAIDSQVQCSLPPAFFAYQRLARMFRTPKRRDAAFGIPNAGDQRYQHHIDMVVSNRNIHVHQSTCTKGASGHTGCRLAMKRGHASTLSTIVQIEEVDDDIDDERDSSGPRTERFKMHCAFPFCYPRRGSPERVKEDVRRDLCNLRAIPPRAPDSVQENFYSPCQRSLALELGRPSLIPDSADQVAQQSKLVQILHRNAAAAAAGESPQAESDALALLQSVLHPDEPLGKLILQDEKMCEALQKVLNDKQAELALKVVTEITSPANVCDNARVAEYSPAMAAALRCNTNVLPTGLGGSGQVTCAYVIKYLSKPQDELAHAEKAVKDSFARCPKSTHADASSDDEAVRLNRERIMFFQTLMNRSHRGLPATVAASIVLLLEGHSSSCAFVYHFGWAFVAAARNAASVPLASRGMQKVCIEAVDVTEERSNSEDDVIDDASSPDAAASTGEHSSNAGNDDIDLLDDDEEEPHGTLGKLVEVLERMNKGSTQSYQVLENGIKRYIPISTACHYAHRDDKLSPISAYEFARHYYITKPTSRNDREFLAQRGGGNHVDDDSTERGRATGRFLLLHPHPLANTHLLKKRGKDCFPLLGGSKPPKLSANMPDWAAAYYVANFCPWSAKEPPTLTASCWYATWRSWLQTAGYDCDPATDAVSSRHSDDSDSAYDAATVDIARGRVTLMTRMCKALRVTSRVQRRSTAYRRRARDFWDQKHVHKPSERQHTACIESTEREDNMRTVQHDVVKELRMATNRQKTTMELESSGFFKSAAQDVAPSSNDHGSFAEKFPWSATADAPQYDEAIQYFPTLVDGINEQGESDAGAATHRANDGYGDSDNESVYASFQDISL